MNEIILFALGFLLGFLTDKIGVLYSKKRKEFSLFGFRMHHTIYGLFFILLSFFIYKSLLFGLGMGIIFWHTVRLRKLVFIEKNF